MKHYSNKYLRYNLRLHRFQFFTVILKTFLKNKIMFDNGGLLKIKNFDKWHLFFSLNLWQLFRSFYFHGLLVNIDYITLMKCFYRLVNMFFFLAHDYILNFLMRYRLKDFRIKFIIVLKIFLFFYIKKYFFLTSKRYYISDRTLLNDKLRFLFFLIQDEQPNMFGEYGYFHHTFMKKILGHSYIKYVENIKEEVYRIFTNQRLSKQLHFYFYYKPHINKFIKQSMIFFYYIDIWLLLYRTKRRLKKFSKLLKIESVDNNLKRRYEKTRLAWFLDRLEKEKRLKKKSLTFKLDVIKRVVKMFIKKKRKKMVNTGNYIDYNKFRFYKKRKKFKYDKRYKGFRFKRGILHLKSSRSNYFITLTDLSYKTIQGVTSGKFAQSPNKKAKKSSTSIYFLLKYLFVFIKAHRINSVVIELKSKFDPVFYQCFNFLRYKRIHIHKIYLSRHLPHHKGLRKRKLRRI